VGDERSAPKAEGAPHQRGRQESGVHLGNGGAIAISGTDHRLGDRNFDFGGQLDEHPDGGGPDLGGEVQLVGFG
jgi:hypothetical protein